MIDHKIVVYNVSYYMFIFSLNYKIIMYLFVCYPGTPLGLPIDQRTHEGRYVWGMTGTSPLAHMVNGHSVNAHSIEGSPSSVLSSHAAAAAAAAAASLYHRISPYDGLYPSPFHTSPTALSLRGLSPGEC